MGTKEDDLKEAKELEELLRTKAPKYMVDDVMNVSPRNEQGEFRNKSLSADIETSKQYVSNALEVFNLPKVDFKDPESVGKNIDGYFRICAKNGSKPSLAGLCLALHIQRESYNTYLKENSTKTTPETRALLLEAKSILNTLLEEYMQTGALKINPATLIFIGKNNFGYVDEIKQTIEHKSLFGKDADEQEISQKYSDDVIDVEINKK